MVRTVHLPKWQKQKKGVTQHSSTKGYGHDRNDFGGAANASPAVLNNWQPAVEAYRGDKVKIIAH